VDTRDEMLVRVLDNTARKKKREVQLRWKTLEFK
jgi:hypothetical protein